MEGWKLHIEGRVQGVGFRPFISRFSRKRNLNGWIRNTNEGVTIFWAVNEKVLDRLIAEMKEEIPPASILEAVHPHPATGDEIEGFRILPSISDEAVNMDLTPDLAMCENCRRELFDPSDRHYHYPFISCTDCGPRYGVQRSTPYDRDVTTMDVFPLCSACAAEYSDIDSRRYHAQSISCPQCGIPFQITDNSGNVLLNGGDEGFWSVINKLLQEGKIIGVKGIGGYLLVADAGQPRTVALLRQRKHRPAKPFAVLYPDLETARRDVLINDEQEGLLCSSAAPIVLCDILEKRDWMEEVAPGLNQLGVMLPYAPILAMIVADYGRPLIATSGNVSGSPIIYRDRQAIEQLSPLVDAFLTNDREIVVPQDDSVVRCISGSGAPVFIRRSRGYAPASPTRLFSGWSGNILAMGSDLKNTLAWRRHQHTYVGQYMGNLESYESQDYLRHLIAHWEGLLKDRPERILIDAHSGYFSHQIGKELSSVWEVEVEKVYHHEAHAFALLGENEGKLNGQDAHVLVWDGTGLGRDDAVWGGELFHFANGRMDRLAHLEYQAQWMGDKMSLEPRIAALAYTRSIPEVQEQLMRHFSIVEWDWYSKLNRQVPQQITSSTGRLFDAAAILAGWRGTRQYESQAAMWLEAMATTYVKANGFPQAAEWQWQGNRWDPSGILWQVHQDARRGDQGLAAARFHSAMVSLVGEIAERYDTRLMGFSGGVFQNALLVGGIREKLGERMCLLWHSDFSPNDECISVGQLAANYFRARVNEEHSLRQPERLLL